MTTLTSQWKHIDGDMVMDCVIIIYLISVYHGDPVIVVPMVF